MRERKFTVGNFVHIYNRGNRKQAIVKEACDKWRFLRMLYYFNTSISITNPFRNLERKLRFGQQTRLVWSKHWLLQKPIVKIIVFALMDNHFHLILKEIIEGGITLFMQKVGVGMTLYFNKKYRETGRLFQGPYKSKVVNNDDYLKYLSVYIQVKNPFELYPQGFEAAVENFNSAFEWAVNYPYCSLADYVGEQNSPIIDKDILGKIFPASEKYKMFSKDSILAINFKEKLEELTIDE